MKLLTATFLAFTALSTAALADSPAVREMNSYSYIEKLHTVHETPMAQPQQGNWGEHPEMHHHHAPMHHPHHGEKHHGEHKGEHHAGKKHDKKHHHGAHHHKHHDKKADSKDAQPAQPQKGAVPQ